MTVGFSRPVSSDSFEASRAVLMIGPSASCASMLNLLASSVYCSMYMRMVAPADPVPDNLHQLLLVKFWNATLLEWIRQQETQDIQPCSALVEYNIRCHQGDVWHWVDAKDRCKW
jgi:hypothetical protein